MKKYLFTFFSVLLASSEVWGQSIWTRVTSTDNWDNDGVYWFTQTTKTGKTTYYYVLEDMNKAGNAPSDNIYYNYVGKKYNKVTVDFLPKIHLFKIIKVSEDEWYIYDINEQKYLTDNGEGNFFNCIALEKDRIEKRNKVKVSFDKNGQMDIIFPAKGYLKYKDGFLRLYAISNKEALSPIVYKLKDYTILDAMADLPQKQGISNVMMYRIFEENLYNTLILPCDVSNYQATFGSGVKAYELIKIDDTNLTIVEKEDLHLTSHTPYLLKGTFGKGPYLLGRQEVSYDGNDPVATVEGGTAHGVFANRTVPEGAYFIYENKFYTYDTEYFNEGMMIAPYKWYVPTDPATAHAKGVKSLGIRESKKDVSTHIDNVRQMPEWKGEVYSLSGQRMNTNAPLPRGIYIRKGKKVLFQR